ncbi:SRPBCC family protein [Streptomyces sp. TR06-5]|uniref:SRPBCC family protein n=1 Tax=Streptomyces sp. TR06-5 TaxID=3385976 RepID=UPI0039A1759B
MELRHEFTVPVPVEDAWRVLLDIERVAPCMPGATVNGFDGETIDGSVKVKVGPMTVTYRGTAAFRERDAAARRIVLAAQGKEARGQGTVRATVTGTLAEDTAGGPASTTVTVHTDLTVTGRPAQFGRGVMGEVGDKLIGRFADCLSGKLAEPAAAPATAAPPAATAGTTPAAGPTPSPGGHPFAAPDLAVSRTEHAHPDGDTPQAAVTAEPGHDEPLDLLREAGLPVAKRAAAALAAAIGLAVLLSWLRRRRR